MLTVVEWPPKLWGQKSLKVGGMGVAGVFSNKNVVGRFFPERVKKHDHDPEKNVYSVRKTSIISSRAEQAKMSEAKQVIRKQA